ncbi:6-bladed beta-propeller [Gemmatimonadota bacterium]
MLLLWACSESEPPSVLIPRLSFEESLSIGLAEGDGPEVLGEVKDVAVDPDGSFYVLDSQAKSVKRFGPEGDFRGEFGREGEGPGEYTSPTGIAADNNFGLYVVDEALLRLTIYKIEGSTVRHIRDVRLPLAPRQICVLGKRLFVVSFHNDHALHELTTDGEVVNSFAYVPKTLLPEISDRWQNSLRFGAAYGQVECAEETDVIAFLPHSWPNLRVFSPQGDSILELEISDYRRQHFRETERGTLQYLPNPETGTAHMGLAVRELAPDLLMIQLLDAGWDHEEVTPETRMIWVSSGAQVSSPDSLPRIATFAGNRGYSFVNAPFPRVSVLEWRLHR